jgi:endonuclease/exonuclease/phosphatase family metal-dependent hydrolase
LPYHPQLNPAPGEEKYSLSPCWQSIGRKLVDLPVGRLLKPYARKVAAVTEIPGKLTIRRNPRTSATANCEGISVVSANLWHDWPLFRRLPERLMAFARMVEQERIDILLLQEVASKSDLHAGEWLADRLGMAYVYGRANGHTSIGFEEGLALLSRFPLEDPHIERLGNSWNPFIHRAALGARVDTPCGEISAFSVHLSLTPRENAHQQEKLRQLIDRWSNGHPVVVGGDFNASETTARIKQAKADWLDTYRHLHPKGDGTTHFIHWPWGGVAWKHRLDYIFLEDREPRWQVVESRHLLVPGEFHSDHRAVLTRLVTG